MQEKRFYALSKELEAMSNENQQQTPSAVREEREAKSSSTEELLAKVNALIASKLSNDSLLSSLFLRKEALEKKRKLEQLEAVEVVVAPQAYDPTVQSSVLQQQSDQATLGQPLIAPPPTFPPPPPNDPHNGSPSGPGSRG